MLPRCCCSGLGTSHRLVPSAATVPLARVSLGYQRLPFVGAAPLSPPWGLQPEEQSGGEPVPSHASRSSSSRTARLRREGSETRFAVGIQKYHGVCSWTVSCAPDRGPGAGGRGCRGCPGSPLRGDAVGRREFPQTRSRAVPRSSGQFGHTSPRQGERSKLPWARGSGRPRGSRGRCCW